MNFSKLFTRSEWLGAVAVLVLAGTASAQVAGNANVYMGTQGSDPSAYGNEQANTSSYTKLIFNGVGSNQMGIGNGFYYRGWCVDRTGFYYPQAYSVQIFNSLATHPLPSLNWDKINWILNNKAGFSVLDVQTAIWKLLDSSYSDMTAGGTTLYNLALANGNGFRPSREQTQGFVVYMSSPGDQDQLGEGNCPLTQGYWKNHEEDSRWPANIMIGSETLSKANALALLRTPVRGDARISLVHQYIAAYINWSSGANVQGLTDQLLAAANALDDYFNDTTDTFDGPAPTGSTGDNMIQIAAWLDAYNNGMYGGCPQLAAR